MADVFISYKSERRRAAEHLAETIQEHGYSVWWDYGLAAGRDFGVQIEKELREASCVLVLWCEKSVASEWVREEAALAKKLDKLVPSMIERVDLPLGFSLSQTIDLSAWSGSPKARELDRIFREIARLSGKPVTVNYDGLERIEKSWVRFGSPSLREFALQNAVEPRSRPRLQGVPNNRGRWLVPAAAGLGLALLVGAGAMYLPGILRPQTEAEEKGDISNEQPSRAAYLPGGSGHVILSGLRGDTAELELLLTSAFSGQLVNDPRLVVLSSDPRIMEERLLAQRAAGLDPARGDPWEGITNPDFRIDLMLSATTDAAGVPTIEARALVRDLDGRLMSSHVTRLVGVGFETEERSRNAVEGTVSV